jgi:hypothetical protein
MQFLKRQITYAVLVAFVACVSIGLTLIYTAVSESLTAERAFHANSLVVELLREYVVSHNGRWPRSWRDLERLPRRECSMFRWPADSEVVRRYVSVDFGADPEKLATESVEEFAAVRPRGPCYPYDEKLADLIGAIRTCRDVQKAKPEFLDAKAGRTNGTHKRVGGL